MDIVDLLVQLGASMTVTVEPYEGRSSNGPLFGEPVVVEPCYVDHKRRMIRSQQDEQVIASSTVYAALGTHCPPGSKITMPDGRVTTALTVAHRDGGGLDVPEHTEIACQ